MRLQCNNKLFNRCVTITIILQKNSLEDGILLFDQPHIHICCERILLFLGNMFKFLGHTQFQEICTTSKEIMLFHDHGFVLLRFVHGLTNNPLIAFISMSWLTGKLDGNARWPYISLRSTGIFLGFSYFALLVMNFDRYLATSYPIFHRTSVTKGRLLTLLAILIIVEITLGAMTVNDFVISFQVHTIIIAILVFPAMLFINYKLFLVVRKSRKNKRISPEMKKTFSLKNISSCLLVVACGVVVSIPWFVYIGLRTNSPDTEYTLDNANVAGLWGKTMALMNCTFNCLIFYWKNKVLRTEGWKVLKSMKICRRVES